MNRLLSTTTFALLALAAVPALAQDHSQLIAGTGISRAVAQQFTLNELAAYRLNRGTDADERQPILPDTGAIPVDPVRHAQLIAAAGLSAAEATGMTLTELAAAKHNAGARGDERLPVAASGPGRANAQLIAAAGLDPATAADLSLSEVAAVKFNRDTRRDDQQTSSY